MATVHIDIPVETAIPAAANVGNHVVTAGSNFPVRGIKFDGGSADDVYYFNLGKIANYGSGNLTTTPEWYADTATSGNVLWGVQFAAITPNTDTQDVETKAFAAESTQQDSHLGTTGQRLHSVDIAGSNLDSLANNDDLWMKLFRKASDTVNDTMAGFAIVTALRLSYSDT